MSRPTMDPRRESVPKDQAKATRERLVKEITAKGFKCLTIGREDTTTGMVELVIVPYYADATPAEVEDINQKVNKLMQEGFEMLRFGDGIQIVKRGTAALDPIGIQFPGS